MLALLLSVHDHHKALLSFPTRRSSDLDHPSARPDFADPSPYGSSGHTVLHRSECGWSHHRPPSRKRPYCGWEDRKSTRLNSSHITISYAVFCLKKKKKRNVV